MSAPADAVSQLTWRMRMGAAGGVTLKTFYGLQRLEITHAAGKVENLWYAFIGVDLECVLL